MKQVERQNLPFLWGAAANRPHPEPAPQGGLAASSVCCPQSLPPPAFHPQPLPGPAHEIRAATSSSSFCPVWKCPLELPGTLLCPLRQQHLRKTGALQGLSHSGFALTAALTFNNQLFLLHPNWACSCVNKLHNFPLHPNLCSFCCLE